MISGRSRQGKPDEGVDQLKMCRLPMGLDYDLQMQARSRPKQDLQIAGSNVKILIIKCKEEEYCHQTNTEALEDIRVG